MSNDAFHDDDVLHQKVEVKEDTPPNRCHECAQRVGERVHTSTDTFAYSAASHLSLPVAIIIKDNMNASSSLASQQSQSISGISKHGVHFLGRINT